MKMILQIFGMVALGGLIMSMGTLPLHAVDAAGLSLHTIDTARQAFQSLNGTRLPAAYHFPYRQAGLTERQAAAHLLSRFTYGATPGQVDAVVQMGLENWFARQLEAQLPDDSLEQVLSRYDALELSN